MLHRKHLALAVKPDTRVVARGGSTMFADFVHLQKLDLGLMPLTAVTDCTVTNADGTVSAAPGAAETNWPGTTLFAVCSTI
jgi:hypothetical protein